MQVMEQSELDVAQNTSKFECKSGCAAVACSVVWQDCVLSIEADLMR